MRLIKLKIKNIASLKEEHEINFAQIQNQSPLFAITGETGAGKSSILNSIGLVLYGKVYKPGVTQNDLVTLGEKEGQIELIFQTEGKNYLAFWKARVRKQNGEPYSTPQTPQRELYTLKGEDFSSPKTILTKRVEELLNLDFDQFCKCIILNQGEFARFLSSSFTERKEILEKLYPGEMLESLSRELKLELDGLQKKKNDLDIELSAISGDGPQGEDLTELKFKLEKECEFYEGWLTSLEKIDYHYSTLSSIHQKHGEAQNKIETVKETLAKETSTFNELLHLSQGAAEELLTVQKEQEAQLPRLQELLKFEEALKHHLEKKNELELEKTKFTDQVTALNLKETQIKEKLSLWETKSKDLRASLKLPLEELKKHQSSFEEIFDLHSSLQSLAIDLKDKEERLSALELQGKEEGQELKELQLKKTTFEADKEELKRLELRKKELALDVEKKNRAISRSEELTLKISQLTQEQESLSDKTLLSAQELTQLQQEYIPLETTLKLQSLLGAIETCLNHPVILEEKACPVCKSALAEGQIEELKATLGKTDFLRLKSREAERSRLIPIKESELHQETLTQKRLEEDQGKKKMELESLLKITSLALPAVDELERKLAQSQKKVWEQEKILRDEERLTQNLNITREQYGTLKKDIGLRSALREKQSLRLGNLAQEISFLTTVSAQEITLLKNESRKLGLSLELDSQGEKLTQEGDYLQENLKEARENWARIVSVVTEIETRIKALNETLTSELKGRKASELISELSLKVKVKADNLMIREKELKTQELRLSESQHRLSGLKELIQEQDLLFAKEIHGLRELAVKGAPPSHEELSKLIQNLRSLALEMTSPADFFLPLRDLISRQKSLFKERTSEIRMNFASVRARLEDWEKRQDRIRLLMLKSGELIQSLERRARLYEVLGKDELRTFVLSLVEENLITQTNDELQKLCQGRYEIIHQSKRMKLTPEFYILDKFREGGLRKVSTLSGGETFMVSLAMALGLAEMTRGKAEIDSLFIDEGFGTLDQESLEDVLDMLKQIQNRGLMVGIISHVKALTNALPVNLQVSKKQDGTSKISVVYN